MLSLPPAVKLWFCPLPVDMRLGIDPSVDLRESLPGLFALGEKPTIEQLLEWLPDCRHSKKGRHTAAILGRRVRRSLTWQFLDLPTGAWG